MQPEQSDTLNHQLELPHHTTRPLFFFRDGPDKYGTLSGPYQPLLSGTPVTIVRISRYNPELALLKAGELLTWTTFWE